MKLLVLLLALAACTHDSRQDTIHAALLSAEVARDEFAIYDAGQQEAIYSSSASGSDYTARIRTYRAGRAKYLAIEATAFAAIYTAAKANDAQSLADMQGAAAVMLAALKPFIVAIEGAK